MITMAKENVKEVIVILEEFNKDAAVPKNVKERVEKTLMILKEKGELAIKVNKALHELEEVADDINLQPYTRTKLLGVVSALERLA